jgi:hypothetical protein
MGQYAATDHRAERMGLAILDGFLGVTAAVGGLCLLLRVPFVTPQPICWLARHSATTPFPAWRCWC